MAWEPEKGGPQDTPSLLYWTYRQLRRLYDEVVGGGGGPDPGPISHENLNSVTPDQHHNQAHLLYGPDHTDVDTAAILAPRHILGENVALTAFEADYRTKLLPFVNGNTYYPQETVFQEGWLSTANKETTDYPAPVPVGNDRDVYLGTSPAAPTTAKQIIFGNRYTWGLNGWVQSYRIYTVSGNNYTIYTVEDPLGAAVIVQVASFTAVDTGWLTINAPSDIILIGTVFDLVVVVSEPDPAPITFTGNWDYDTPNNTGTPGTGVILHANRQTDQLRVHKIDDAGADRGAELLALGNGDIVEIGPGGTRWSIQSVSDVTTYVILTVSPATQDSPDGVRLFTFETVAATPITRLEDTNWWGLNPLPNGTVEGLYIEDDVYANIVPNTSAYGVDIRVQEATLSDDWDIYGAPGGGSGGSGSFVPDLFTGAGTSGYVPDPVTETGKHLSDDGSWVDPAAFAGFWAAGTDPDDIVNTNVGNVGIGGDPGGSVTLQVTNIGADFEQAITLRSNGGVNGWARMDWQHTSVAEPGIIYQDNGGNFVIRNNGSNTLILDCHGTHPIIFKNTAVEQMRLTDTGRLGIGRNNPQASLDVDEDIIIHGAGFPALEIRDNAENKWNIQHQVSSHSLRFAYNGSAYLTLYLDGRIRMHNLPTSSAGLVNGDLWRNGSVVNIV